MTENRSKSNKKLLFLILADILVITIAVVAVMAILPLFSTKHIKNTADAMLFDFSEILSGNALEFSAELDIPDELTEFEGDLHLAVGSAHDKNNGNGKADLTFGVGEKSLSLDLLYDSETVTIGGLGTDPSLPVSLPRRNLKEAFDKSHFFYGSGSLHSMSMSAYNSLIPALDEALDPDREANAFFDAADDIIKISEPTSSFVFSKGKLCRRYTCSLDAEKIVKILGLFADMDKTQIQAIKDSIGNKTFTLTYVTDGKYITSTEISSEILEADVELIYDKDTSGFKAEVIYTFDNSGESIGVIGSTKYELTYSKTVGDTEVTADLSLWSQSSGTRDYSFKLNKADSSYSLVLNGNEIATGICELDGDALHLTVIVPESDSAIASVSIKKSDSFVAVIPEHRPLLGMSEDELTDFLRNIPIQTASDLLGIVADIDLTAFMTADGKLLLHADKVMAEAQKLYGPYVSLLKTTDKDILDTVSRIYVWNDRVDAYILFTYLIESDSLELGCAYELTDEILAEYHIADLTDNGIMYAHSFERVEKVDPTCDEDGREVYACVHCEYTYQTDQKAIGHENSYVNVYSKAHDGTQMIVNINKCSRCGAVSRISSSNYFSTALTPDKNGGYTVSKYEALKELSIAYLYLPPLSDADIQYSGITVTYSDDAFEAINIPEGIEKLYKSNVYLSKAFRVLVLPSTLKEIEDSAFYGIGTPSVIFYSGSREDWDKIRLGEYSTLWADVKLICCPGGVTHEDVSKQLFLPADLKKAVERQKQLTLNPDAAREVAKNDRVTLISEEQIAFVDYDEESSLIAYCGVSVGFKTQIGIYDMKAGKIVDSFTVSDHVNKLAIREGYVAMGGDYSTAVYVYDLASKEISRFKIDTDATFDSISQIFIDSGFVYASTKNSYQIASYSLRDAKINKVLETWGFDHIIMNREYHRLILVEKYYSEIFFNLYDTATFEFIKKITFSEGTTSSRVSIPHFENVIVTDLGTVYDFDGNVTTEAPLNTPLVTITPPDGLPVASKLYEDIDGAMSLFAESGLKVLLALQKAGSDEPIILDYYAEEAIVTKDGCMIVYTPNSYGLLLVDLP